MSCFLLSVDGRSTTSSLPQATLRNDRQDKYGVDAMITFLLLRTVRAPPDRNM